MTASVIGIGRFHGQDVDIDACLGVCVLSALVAMPVLGTPAALAFLAIGLSVTALRPRIAASDLLTFKVLLILPAFCMASTLWSDVPGASLRSGLQLAATVVIAIIVARRLPLRTYIVALMIGLLICVTISIIFGNYRSDTGALTGIYASKNAVGMAAAFLALIAIGLVDIRMWNKPMTVVALLGTAVGMSGAYLSQSVSALLAILVGVFVLGMVYFYRRSRMASRVVTGLFAMLLIAFGSLLALTNFDAFSDIVLRMTGKEVTLTGRTELWSIALDLIEERPLLGAGYEAFWVPQNPLAQSLWYWFGIESQSGFSFHNAYLSNAVEIGILGVTIQVVMIASAVVLSVQRALSDGEQASAVLAALLAMIVSFTAVDTHVFFQFNLSSVIMVSAIVYGQSARRERAAGVA